MFNLKCIKSASESGINKENASLLCRAIWLQCAPDSVPGEADITFFKEYSSPVLVREKITMYDGVCSPVLVRSNEHIWKVIINVSPSWLLWAADQPNGYEIIVSAFIVAAYLFEEYRVKGAGNPWQSVQRLREEGVEFDIEKAPYTSGYRFREGSNAEMLVEEVLDALEAPTAWQLRR